MFYVETGLKYTKRMDMLITFIILFLEWSDEQVIIF